MMKDATVVETAPVGAAAKMAAATADEALAGDAARARLLAEAGVCVCFE